MSAVEIEVTCRYDPKTGGGINRRGLLWSATATHDGRTFRVESSLQPVRDALRAVIDGTPGFGDAAWRVLRDGRVDLFGSSARGMAARTVSGGEAGTFLRLDNPVVAAIYAPSAPQPVGRYAEAAEAAGTGRAA
jgi:hypothetical protein